MTTNLSATWMNQIAPATYTSIFYEPRSLLVKHVLLSPNVIAQWGQQLLQCRHCTITLFSLPLHHLIGVWLLLPKTYLFLLFSCCLLSSLPPLAAWQQLLLTSLPLRCNVIDVKVHGCTYDCAAAIAASLLLNYFSFPLVTVGCFRCCGIFIITT